MLKKLIISFFIFSATLFGSEINWEKDFFTALKSSKEQNKPILFVLSSHSCHFCKVLDKDTFQNQEVIEALNKDFISVIAYTDDGDYVPRYLWRPGTPALWFLLENGEPMFQAVMGAIPAKQFLVALEKVKQEFKQYSKK